MKGEKEKISELIDIVKQDKSISLKTSNKIVKHLRILNKTYLKCINVQFCHSMTDLNKHIDLLDKQYHTTIKIISISASEGGFYLFYEVK